MVRAVFVRCFWHGAAPHGVPCRIGSRRIGAVSDQPRLSLPAGFSTEQKVISFPTPESRRLAPIGDLAPWIARLGLPASRFPSRHGAPRDPIFMYNDFSVASPTDWASSLGVS